MEFPVPKRRHWTVRAKRPSGVKKAQTLSTVRRPRSVAKRSVRKAKREVKKPRWHVLPHTQCLTLLLQIQRRTTHCVLHHGAESQRATRSVYSFNQFTILVLFKFIIYKVIMIQEKCSALNHSSCCVSGKLGPVRRQLQSVVPPGLCGSVCRASREGGVYLHKLHTARLQQRRMKTKMWLWRISSFCCQP